MCLAGAMKILLSIRDDNIEILLFQKVEEVAVLTE